MFARKPLKERNRGVRKRHAARPGFAPPDVEQPPLPVEVGDSEFAQLAVARAGEKGRLDQIAEGASAAVEKPGALLGAQEDLARAARAGEGAKLAPRGVGGDEARAPGMIEEGPQRGQIAVCAFLGPARRFLVEAGRHQRVQPALELGKAQAVEGPIAEPRKDRSLDSPERVFRRLLAAPQSQRLDVARSGVADRGAPCDARGSLPKPFAGRLGGRIEGALGRLDDAQGPISVLALFGAPARDPGAAVRSAPKAEIAARLKLHPIRLAPHLEPQPLRRRVNSHHPSRHRPILRTDEIRTRNQWTAMDCFRGRQREKRGR
ncbi:MAG: hypothetical protein RML56_13520 [Burkholderiales bacterium]|nr:hypothetical protein [Burkholderiales bacterium]